MICAVALAVAAACDDDDNEPAPSAARRIEISATEYAFTPNLITAAKGERLLIVLSNRGKMEHAISFEFPSGEMTLDNVGPGLVTQKEIIVPNEDGMFTFYCPISNHRALGMEGTLMIGTGTNPPGEARADLELVADDFTSPVAMAFAPGDASTAYIADLAGTITAMKPEAGAERNTFLDLSDKLPALMPDYDERGLLGLAFHPNYAANGLIYVYYSIPLRANAPAGYDHTNRLSEMRISDTNAGTIDRETERVLLEVDWPQMNHNGGTLAFGPDGALYLSTGDGGGANDVGLGHDTDLGNGQVEDDLFGSILRFDVDSASTAPEVWAYGFRNPYRFSFDMAGDRAMYVGDAGQDLYEEVDIVEHGGNYGWNIREGTHCFDPKNPKTPPASCAETDADGDPLLMPIIEFENSSNFPNGLGNVVIGGYVYRGTAVPAFAGKYVFGTFAKSFETATGNLLVATPRNGALWAVEEIMIGDATEGGIGHYLLGFGEDPDGDLFVLTTDNAGPTGTTGKVYRLKANAAAPL